MLKMQHFSPSAIKKDDEQIELMSALCSSGKSTFKREQERPQCKMFDKDKCFSKITHRRFNLMISERNNLRSLSGSLRVYAAILCRTYNKQKKTTLSQREHLHIGRVMPEALLIISYYLILSYG